MFRTKAVEEDAAVNRKLPTIPTSRLKSPVVMAGSRTIQVPKQITEARDRRVFVTHGKNKNLVPQLKELLSFGQFEPVVSVDRESVAKPVPDKVMDDMRSSEGAAIIHVDAEGEMITTDGEREIILNANVLTEIGASLALYPAVGPFSYRARCSAAIKPLWIIRGAIRRRERLDGEATLKLLKAFNEF